MIKNGVTKTNEQIGMPIKRQNPKPETNPNAVARTPTPDKCTGDCENGARNERQIVATTIISANVPKTNLMSNDRDRDEQRSLTTNSEWSYLDWYCFLTRVRSMWRQHRWVWPQPSENVWRNPDRPVPTSDWAVRCDRQRPWQCLSAVDWNEAWTLSRRVYPWSCPSSCAFQRWTLRNSALRHHRCRSSSEGTDATACHASVARTILERIYHLQWHIPRHVSHKHRDRNRFDSGRLHWSFASTQRFESVLSGPVDEQCCRNHWPRRSPRQTGPGRNLDEENTHRNWSAEDSR